MVYPGGLEGVGPKTMFKNHDLLVLSRYLEAFEGNQAENSSYCKNTT